MKAVFATCSLFDTSASYLTLQGWVRARILEQDISPRLYLLSRHCWQTDPPKHFGYWVLYRESSVSLRANQSEQSWELSQELLK